MPFITPTNLPDKLTTPSTVVCQSPDCDVDTDFCNHPKIDVDKQNMQGDVELQDKAILEGLTDAEKEEYKKLRGL